MDATPICEKCGRDVIEVTAFGHDNRTYRSCGCSRVHGRRLGRALVEALGLDGRKVRRITIDAAVDNAATVTVEMFVEVRHELEQIVKQYVLVDPDVVDSKTA